MKDGELPGTGATFNIRPERAFVIKGYPGLECHCLAGELWVTQEGDLRDYIMQPGHKMIASHDGKLIVATLRAGTACAYIKPPQRHSDDIEALEFESNTLERFLRRVEARRNAAIADAFQALWRWLCRRLKNDRA